jgi:DNA invertase Pin-like site-specific DNA recombinase
MLSHTPNSKIQLEHLERDALIYVRQSSLMQVRDHTASTMRQYDLVQRALSLGWERSRIHVIDQDQGHSGSSTIGRDGFQSLVGGSELIHLCKSLVLIEKRKL